MSQTLQPQPLLATLAALGMQMVCLHAACSHARRLPLEERMALALSVGEECVQPEELRMLLEKKPNPIAYDGFEPSGRMHIAQVRVDNLSAPLTVVCQGVLKCINVNKLTKCGVHFKFWVADWFAQLNNKMGGDLKKIQTVGQYFVEIWKAVGMDMTRVEFLNASEEINKRPDEYWTLVCGGDCHSRDTPCLR